MDGSEYRGVQRTQAEEARIAALLERRAAGLGAWLEKLATVDEDDEEQADDEDNEEE